MFRIALGCCLAALSTSLAWGADKPVFAPSSAWVKPEPLPSPSTATDSAPLRILLSDSQAQVTAAGEDRYEETVMQVASPAGLQALGNLAFPWDPATTTLVIHKLHIIRGGQVIDLAAGGQNLMVLRRENNLERAMLDGWLTAALAPAGLQVGDLVDIAVTYQYADPLLKGHVQFALGVPRQTPVGRLHMRLLWPRARAVKWRELPGLPPAKVSDTPEGSELLIEAQNLPTLQPPKQAPLRFQENSRLEVSDFADWAQASSLMAPLYAKASTLAPDSPLKAEVEKIRAASPDPKAQAALALHLVQDQVRYLFLGMDLGGYLPADADVTWMRRFGDCKGKTVLLLALLRQLGIQAEPAFVNATAGDGIDQDLPSDGPFNHVIVRAAIGGKVYWLDGTRQNDRTLDDIRIPPFEWALPVRDQGSSLEKLVEPPLDKPLTEMTVRFDASKGLDAPAAAHIEMIMRGDLATSLKLAVEAMQPEQRDRFLHDYWKKEFDFVAAKATSVTFEPATGEEHLVLDGSANMGWQVPPGGSEREYATDDTAMGWRADFSRPAGFGADAPFKMAFPMYSKLTETIVLPDGGRGFHIVGSNVDRTIAGLELKRRAHIEGGVFTVEATVRSVSPEITATEARGAQHELVRLTDDSLYVQAPAGSAQAQAQASAQSSTAMSLMGEGARFLAGHQLDAALAEFNRAAELAPELAAAYLGRGEVLLEKGDLDGAQADFDKALKLSPGLAPAMLGKGHVLFARHQAADAIALYDQALQADPKNLLGWVLRAVAYQELGRDNDAKADYDRALEIDPNSAAALTDRALLEMKLKQYDAALADADKAIAAANAPSDAYRVKGWLLEERNQPQEAIKALDIAVQHDLKDADALSIRGWAKLQLFQDADALADFDRALELHPSLLPALSGRGTALARLGRYAEAVQDYTKALDVTPADARPRLLIQRADAYHQQKQDDLAQADMNAMISLQPKAASSYFSLAGFLKRKGDYPGALKALADAHRLDPDNAAIVSFRADILQSSGQYVEGLKILDELISQRTGKADLLNKRCWYRATAGKELERALADCDAAIKLGAPGAQVLDSRGLVELRLGRFELAIADYDAALKLRPAQPTSLFGRGLSKLRSGQVKDGQADLAAAHVSDPKVEEEFAGYGLTP